MTTESGLTLAGVEARRPEGDEMADLLLLITMDGWSEVETQSDLPGLRRHPLTVPGDLRATPRRADRGLETLIPDQRPPQRLAPEVPDLPRTGAGKLSRNPQPARYLLPGSITRTSLPSGSASTI